MLETLDPNLLAFLSAVTFAASQTLYRNALLKVSVAATTIAVNTTIFLVALALFLASGEPLPWSPLGILYFMAVGFFGAYLGRYLNYLSINYIGLSRTHVLTQTQPVWSAFLAMAFLGETLGRGVGAGTAAIVAGSILLVRERRGDRPPLSLRMYLVPIGTAVLMGFTPTLRKLGFQYISSPPFALAVGMATGALLQLVTSLALGEEGTLKWKGNALAVIIVGGVLNAFAALSPWTAIKHGEVVKLIPITRLSVLFVLLFSWIFFRKLERISWQVIAGAALAVAGAVVISWSR